MDLSRWLSMLMRPTAQSEPGDGARRAEERLAEHRKKWDGVTAEETVTRQQRRAQRRVFLRRRRAVRRTERSAELRRQWQDARLTRMDQVSPTRERHQLRGVQTTMHDGAALAIGRCTCGRRIATPPVEHPAGPQTAFKRATRELRRAWREHREAVS